MLESPNVDEDYESWLLEPEPCNEPARSVETLLESRTYQLHFGDEFWIGIETSRNMSEEFYDTAVAGDLDKLGEMLSRDPELVHSKDKWEFTALHGVAGEDLTEVAEFLLSKGANPNARNDEGITPLHFAVYPNMVELLVKYGAEIDVRSNDGSTPLLVQAAEAEGIDVMQTLLKLGADPQAKDNMGRSALDIARSRNEGDKVELFEEGGSGASRKWWKFW